MAGAATLGAQRAESRRLWLAALDQKAVLATDSSLTLLRAAVRADTTFLPAFRDYLGEMRVAGRSRELRREFPEPADGATAFSRCRWGLSRAGFDGDVAAVRSLVRQLAAMSDPSGCVAGLVTSHSGSNAEARRKALSFDSLWSGHWIAYADGLRSAGKGDSAAAALLEGIGGAPHAVQVLHLQLNLVDLRKSMGDSVAARRLLAAIGTSVERDGRPYFRVTYFSHLIRDAWQLGDDALADSLYRRQVELARRARAAALEFVLVSEQGSRLFDVRNDPKGAIALLSRALSIAQAMESPSHVRMAYDLRGRAYNKLGDFRRAEQDLKKALAATAPDDWTSLSEAHHNLAHVYEGLGQWVDAAREVDLYTGYAWRVRDGSAAYMMSFHDAGQIRWKAGWHAASRRSFEEMVRLTEERDANHYYAGEYYERIGDFARAASYYDRGARSPETGELHLNLAGLARMYQALGLHDSATMAAVRHDQLTQYGVSRLRPAALMASGRAAEAIALARTDVAEREVKGSPLQTTTALLQLARLLLEAGRSTDADVEAARAERLAQSANLTEEAVEAIQIRGVAQLQGRSRSAIATLLRARSLVRSHPSAASELRVESALGDAYAAAGETAASLIAYDRAASASQRVTSSFESALDRARNRDQRVAPFDGALRVLLMMPPSPSRSEQLLAWSVRKKSAVWRTGGVDSTDFRRGLASLQARLGANTAVVDYLTVDSVIFAHVITPRAWRLVRLPVSVAMASDLVQRLRRPLTVVEAGQLDLARAPFDLTLAHRLYLGLFGPIESLLGDAENIVLVPDGPLYSVPFSALPMALGAPGPNAHLSARYVIDRWAVTLASSPVFSSTKRARQPAAARVLVMLGSVPGGEREVAGIRGAWSEQSVNSLTGSRATEAALRMAASSSSVLHFAVHARADEGDPLASHLELARDSIDDGFLHINEVAALRFTGDLVVLTACETLPGRVFAGTGPFGIANSFIAAGARNVIATHWPVGEAAADLSRDLHAALARGVEPSEALRSAQLKLRRTPLRAHPFYWAGYALIVGAQR